MNKQDVYEEFYQYRKVPSTEPQWIELRELVDKLMADVERDTIERVLYVIDKLYNTTCDRYSKVGYMESARNELRMCGQAVKALKGGECDEKCI